MVGGEGSGGKSNVSIAPWQVDDLDLGKQKSLLATVRHLPSPHPLPKDLYVLPSRARHRGGLDDQIRLCKHSMFSEPSSLNPGKQR